jgi:hypothetical protein
MAREEGGYSGGGNILRRVRGGLVQGMCRCGAVVRRGKLYLLVQSVDFSFPSACFLDER